MATVLSVITSARYDIKDGAARDPVDDVLVDFVNRAVHILDSQLSSLGSDFVHQTETLTLSAAANSVSIPTRCIRVRSLWISTDELDKMSTDAMYNRRKYLSTTGQPDFWANEGANIIFDKTADAEYSITAHFDQRVDTLVKTDSMPYSDEFNEVIREAIVMMARNRDGQKKTYGAADIEMAIKNVAVQKIIAKNFIPRTRWLSF